MSALLMSITALAGWLAGPYLLSAATFLLGRVAPEDVVPAGPGTSVLTVPAITLSDGWRHTYRIGLAGLLFLLVWRRLTSPFFDWPVFLLDALCIALFWLVGIIDGASHLIFHECLVALMLLGLVLLGVQSGRTLLPAIIGLGAMGSMMLLFYGLGYLFYRTEALGFGDVLLSGVMGFILGWPSVFGAVVLAMLLLLATSVILLLLRRATLTSFLPLGLFLSLGACLTLLLLPTR